MIEDKKKKIVVALSGGGDRTYYYAGIIYGLKQKYDIVEISTVSGASYTVPLTINASNFSQALSMSTKFNPLDFVVETPNDKIMERKGLYSLNDRFYKYLKALIPAKTGAEHTPKLSPMASYISNQYPESINLRNIPLTTAIAASISLPFLFTPIKFKGRELFDGALAGTVNTDIFKKYPKLPSIILKSEKDEVAMITTVMKGIKYLKSSPMKLFQIKKLADNNEVIKKIISHIARTTDTHGNFSINCDSVASYGLLLSDATKRKLFTLGYKKSFEIYPQLDYYITTGRYKQLINHPIDA